MIRNDDNFNDTDLINLFNFYGKNFQIYNEPILNIIKKRGIKVDLKKNHYSYGTKTDSFSKYIGELKNGKEHGKGQLIFNYNVYVVYGIHISSLFCKYAFLFCSPSERKFFCILLLFYNMFF